MKVRILLLLIITLVSIEKSTAQFDRKVTFSGYAGYIIPLGDEIDPDSIPNIFPNFKTGFNMGIGGEYNFSHNFSAGFTLATTYVFNYKDPIPLASSITVGDGKDDSYFFMTTVGTDFRYKFLHQRAFNPYLFGQIDLNIFNGQVEPHYSFINQTKGYDHYDPTIQSKYTILRYNARKIETGLAFGVLAGTGFDLKLSNTFVLFLQGSYNLKFTKGNDVIQRNIQYLNAQAGLRFSLFKSKSIL